LRLDSSPTPRDNPPTPLPSREPVTFSLFSFCLHIPNKAVILRGPAWSEARLLGYGYAYEQSAKAKVTPRFLPSIEGVAPVAPLLQPLQHWFPKQRS
jgi:hypothetical protein